MIEADSEQLYAFVRFDIDRFQLINSFSALMKVTACCVILRIELKYLPVSLPPAPMAAWNLISSVSVCLMLI